MSDYQVDVRAVFTALEQWSKEEPTGWLEADDAWDELYKLNPAHRYAIPQLVDGLCSNNWDVVHFSLRGIERVGVEGASADQVMHHLARVIQPRDGRNTPLAIRLVTRLSKRGAYPGIVEVRRSLRRIMCDSRAYVGIRLKCLAAYIRLGRRLRTLGIVD